MKLISPLLLACLLSGCSNMMKHLKNDNATVDASMVTVYGNVKIFRTVVGTNQTLTRTPDGTIKIESK
jgi:uncharacterized protein YceK